MLTQCRIRALREEPYTQEEADAAAGLGTDNGAQKETSLAETGSASVAMDVEPSEPLV